MKIPPDHPSTPDTKRAAGKPAGVARGTSARAQVGNPVVTHNFAEVTLQQRHTRIAEAAYYKAQLRGFEPGHELEDWLVAESQIDAALAGGSRAAARPA